MSQLLFDIHVSYRNLGKNPSADRLFINFICHSGKNIKEPPMDLPEDFENQLVDIGYAL